MSAAIRADIHRLNRDVEELKRQVAELHTGGRVVGEREPVVVTRDTKLVDVLDKDVSAKLIDAGYATVSDLPDNDDDLLEVKGIGPASVKAIRAATVVKG